MQKRFHLSTAAWTSFSFLLAGVSAANAQDVGPPPVRSTLDANGVDLLSGALNLATPSVSIGQTGAGGLMYQRYYDSTAGAWRDNMAGVINSVSGIYTVTLYGSSAQFSESGGAFTEVEARGAKLTFNSGTNRYTFTSADGAVAIYDKSLQYGIGLEANEGRLVTLTEPDGLATTFTYVTISGGYLVNRLQSVNNTRGYQLKLDYATDTAGYEATRITKVTAINNSVDFCSLAANGCSGLTQSWPSLTFGTSSSSGVTTDTVTDSLGQQTKYLFSTNSVGMRRPSSPSTNNLTYTLSGGAVSSVSNGSSSWSYGYSVSGDTRTTTMTDPLSHARVVTSSISDAVVLTDKNALNKTTTFEYDASNRLQKVIYPEGNNDRFSYDSRGNVTEVRRVGKSGAGASDIVTTSTYNSTCANPVTCNLPTAVTDALGFTTDFTYNSTHGGVLTVTSPAPASGAVQPQTRFFYETVPAYYKTSAGGSLQQGPALTGYQLHLGVRHFKHLLRRQ